MIPAPLLLFVIVLAIADAADNGRAIHQDSVFRRKTNYAIIGQAANQLGRVIVDQDAGGSRIDGAGVDDTAADANVRSCNFASLWL